MQKDGGSDVTNYDVSVKSSDTSWGVLYAPLLAGNTAIGGKMDRSVCSTKSEERLSFSSPRRYEAFGGVDLLRPGGRSAEHNSARG